MVYKKYLITTLLDANNKEMVFMILSYKVFNFILQ